MRKALKKMNLDFLKGKRFWLFVIIGLTGAIQAIQPMVGEQTAGVFTAVLAFLGILKTLVPYEPSGEISLKK